ncbi:peptide chain release factor N(5)-glutamine methyltransferase [Qipengyuania sp. JC766]|uniref:peptide chain release factor N(5)-glutamine methyltransferase n=1 Tax=Qipengyuania sp. JC766 TaxID=3232139 RepID=UPI00345AAB74
MADAPGGQDGTTKAGEALRAATDRLAATSDTPRLDAELLMAHALDVSRSDLLLRHLGAAVPDGFAALVERRAAREPVAYIIGRQEFYGLDLRVSPDVLIPRGDSETLIEAARARFETGPPARILDLGTGSGALLLAAMDLFPDAEGVGLDASFGAVRMAQCNARRLGMADRARFLRRNWRKAGWARDLGRFDLVLCNPPYVETTAELEPEVAAFEPASALFSGLEGLDDYTILLPQVGDHLSPHGLAIFEIGHEQGDSVAAIGTAAGLQSRLHRDLAGRARALSFTVLGH